MRWETKFLFWNGLNIFCSYFLISSQCQNDNNIAVACLLLFTAFSVPIFWMVYILCSLYSVTTYLHNTFVNFQDLFYNYDVLFSFRRILWSYRSWIWQSNSASPTLNKQSCCVSMSWTLLNMTRTMTFVIDHGSCGNLCLPLTNPVLSQSMPKRYSSQRNLHQC